MRRLAVTGVAAAALLGAGGAWLVYASPVFDIRDVTVVGAPDYLADPIEQAAGITQGGPLVSVDLGVIEDRVGQLIDIQQVSAQRQWPHTVVISVTPRTTVGVVPTTGGVEIVGSDGAAMGTIDAAPAGLPVVKGSGDDRRRVSQALGTLDPQTLAAVEWAQVREGDIELQLRDGRGFVLWGGDDNATTKGKALAVLLAYDQDARWFDLSRAGTPTTLVAPPAGARAPAATASPTPSPSPTPLLGQPESGSPPVAEVPQVTGTGGELPAGLVPQPG
jgi:cell division protein FtsQ